MKVIHISALAPVTLEKTIEAFTALYMRYGTPEDKSAPVEEEKQAKNQNRFFKQAKGFWNASKSLVNQATGFIADKWLQKQYVRVEKELVRPYRLGIIDTENFFKSLRKEFTFLESDTLEISTQDHSLIETHREKLLISLGKDTIDNPTKILCLIEMAWQKMISLQPNIQKILASLTQEKEPVYIVGVTCRSHLNLLCKLLKDAAPEAGIFDSPDYSQIEKTGFVGLSKNLIVLPSHLASSHHKKEKAQKSFLEHINILSALVKKNGKKFKDVHYVGADQASLTQAVKAGVPPSNCKLVTDLLAPQPPKRALKAGGVKSTKSSIQDGCKAPLKTGVLTASTVKYKDLHATTIGKRKALPIEQGGAASVTKPNSRHEPSLETLKPT